MRPAFIMLLICEPMFAGDFEVRTWKQEVIIEGVTTVHETELVKQRDRLVVGRDGFIVGETGTNGLPRGSDHFGFNPRVGRDDLGYAFDFGGAVDGRISLTWQVPSHLCDGCVAGAAEHRRTYSYVPSYNPDTGRYEPTEVVNGYPIGLPVTLGDGWWHEYPLGDINLDGKFDSTDLIRLLSGNEWGPGYEWSREAEPPYSFVTYFNGDINNDGYFDSLDIIALFKAGTYVGAENANVIVPEPTGIMLAVFALVAMLRRSS